MKSIMEEASSIFKAIEKGWNSAGNPKEFTIKIFEEPQKNFIGMTVRPAKIGIFFTESAPQKSTEQQAKRRKQGQQEERQKTVELPQQARGQKTRTPRPKEAPEKEQRIQEPRQEARQLDAELKQGPIWTDEMIETVKDWITEMLPSMDLDRVPFTVNPQHFHLKIQFQNDLYDDKTRQKYLFANVSNLLLTMLKRQYKRPLKGYKIVLLGGE